jgi:hypothetical protein
VRRDITFPPLEVEKDRGERSDSFSAEALSFGILLFSIELDTDGDENEFLPLKTWLSNVDTPEYDLSATEAISSLFQKVLKAERDGLISRPTRSIS